MKLLRKLLCLLTVCAVCPAVFAGCGGGDQKTETGPSRVVLADFETYIPDFSLLRLQDRFGRISVNTDPAYVKSGKQSALIQPLGGYSNKTDPCFFIPLTSDTYDFAHNDFSRVKEITLSVYNAEEKDVDMEMGLVTELNGMVCNRAMPREIILTPGWNDIRYKLDLSVLNISYFVDDIVGIYFAFDRVGSRDPADAPKLYMDDVALEKSDTDIEIKNFIQLKENEIADFEQAYQAYAVTADVKNANTRPDISIVEATGYGLVAPSGTRVLRVDMPAGDGLHSWPKFVVAEKLVRASGLMSVPEEEYADTYICFEVYNNHTADVTLYPEFYSTGGGDWSAFNMRAVSKKWTTYRIALSTLKEVIVKDPGYIKIAWYEFGVSTAEHMEMFFDNFRIERAK